MGSKLEIIELSKSFFSNEVLKKVNLTFEPGKVHVLLGENGAGKSTILKLIIGQYPFDSGEILYNDQSIAYTSPLEARKNGIAMIYQELSLLPEMTVLDNVFLGGGITKAGILSRKSMEKRFSEVCEEYGITVDKDALVKSIPLSKQIMVEVLKALITDPKVIFFDEATSALDSDEVQCLFNVIRKLKNKNRVIVFISHRMEELFQIGDKVSVLKDGEMVGTKLISETSQRELIEMMVGRTIDDIFPPKDTPGTKVLLELKNVSNDVLHDISITAHENEIVSIAGLKGHGQSELLQCIAGLIRYKSGAVFIDGKEATYKSARSAIKNGVILVPEDRKLHGLFLKHSIERNLSVSSEYTRQKAGVIRKKEEKRFVDDAIRENEIKCKSPKEIVTQLSGGNQQKVVIGRALGIEPRMILFNEPTRGIDVKTKRDIYQRLRELAKNGVSVIVYSSDLLEVIGISDKVYTMYEGKITRELKGSDINEVEIMKGAVGER